MTFSGFGSMARRTFVGAVAGLGVAPAFGIEGERPTRVRHYVLATRDMNFVCDQIYEVLGLPPTPRREGPGPTEAYGFQSTMMRVGTTMIEVVEPVSGGKLLDKWFDERGGDGGFMIVMQTYDAGALKVRAAAEKLTLTRDMKFQTQDMIQFDYQHFGTHFELYKYTPEDDWWGHPATGPYADARVVSDIYGSEVAVEKPLEIAAQAARLFLGRQEGSRVHFGDRSVNFIESKGSFRGLVALDLKARESRRVGDWARIAGVEFRLV